MFPYIHIPVYHLGPIDLDPWGLLVISGFVLGLEIARARGLAKGLDVRDIVDGVTVTVLSGFVFGHLVHVLAYHPEMIEQQGFAAIYRIWAGFSSFGGFLGAVIGSVYFFNFGAHHRDRFWAWFDRVVNRREPALLPPARRDYWAHADVVMYAFPFAWIFGRGGCALVHDHIGRPTDFFLAVNFDNMMPGMGVRHDLGLYECFYSMFISAVFFALRKKQWPAGAFLALWCFLYAPVRFCLDFLRRVDQIPGVPLTPDVRWAGLTPAQWGCLVMLGAGTAIFVRVRGQMARAAAVGKVETGGAN